jgi:hypothetical protein
VFCDVYLEVVWHLYTVEQDSAVHVCFVLFFCHFLTGGNCCTPRHNCLEVGPCRIIYEAYDVTCNNEENKAELVSEKGKMLVIKQENLLTNLPLQLSEAKRTDRLCYIPFEGVVCHEPCIGTGLLGYSFRIFNSTPI